MKPLNYLIPASAQTLQEGMEELRLAEMENDAAEDISPELARDIDEHDAIHTLFACSTDLKGEILAHVWSVFGTTMNVKQMKKVNVHQDHRFALREIGHFKLLITWLSSMPSIIRTILCARRMSKKFPIAEYEQFLDRELCELRKEFQIRLSP